MQLPFAHQSNMRTKIAVKFMYTKEKGVTRALEYAVTLYPTFYTELL